MNDYLNFFHDIFHDFFIHLFFFFFVTKSFHDENKVPNFCQFFHKRGNISLIRTYFYQAYLKNLRWYKIFLKHTVKKQVFFWPETRSCKIIYRYITNEDNVILFLALIENIYSIIQSLKIELYLHEISKKEINRLHKSCIKLFLKKRMSN